MTKEQEAGKLIVGDEFVVISRRGNTEVTKRTYLATEKKPAIQANNEQLIGVSSDGIRISLGQNTKIRRVEQEY